MKYNSTVMVLYVQRNYLNLLSNEMDIVFIQSIKYKKKIVFVEVIVYI